MSTSLDVEVRAELDRRRGDWQQIAEAAQVSHSWISQFVRQKIPNPGFMTLTKLKGVLFDTDKPRRRRNQRDEKE